MSLLDEASRLLAPHTQAVAGTIDRHGRNITERLDELAQSSDLGRPDTADVSKFLIVNAKLKNERISFDQLTGGNDDGGPSLGEIWLVQSICVNGQPNKSPGFAVRTNTGRLVFAVVPEGMGNETCSGSVYLLQGEVIYFEPLAEGVFDFTVTLLQRKFPRSAPDAGWGVSEEHMERNSRAFEHEPERDFPGQAFPAAQDQHLDLP